MFLVLIAAVTGAGLALLLRGGQVGLPEDLRARPALALGVLGLIVAEWIPVPGRPGIFIVATVLVVAGLLQNVQFSGATVTALGLALTGFVVLINGFLPLRAEAADARGIEASGLRQLEVEGTRLGILGDVVPLPPGPWVLSFGDLIAAAGAFILARGLLAARADEGLDADEFLARYLAADGKAAAAPGGDAIDLTIEERPAARQQASDREPVREASVPFRELLDDDLMDDSPFDGTTLNSPFEDSRSDDGPMIDLSDRRRTFVDQPPPPVDDDRYH